ncbi:MAG: hypothetical protein KJ049_10170 [Gammaproteobacteria bacterium]|nr:hypothetical protein [Gammaproteobacteria bacterium]
MGILDIFRKKPVAAGSRRPAVSPARRSQPPADYGANPYDTYTWELHTDIESGERELKRAHLVDRPKADGESFNPYDTGKFSGGW